MTVDEAAYFREHGYTALRGVVAPARAMVLASEVDRVFPESRVAGARVHERIGISALSPLLAEQVRNAIVSAGFPEETMEQDDGLSVYVRDPDGNKIELYGRRAKV